MARSPRCEIPRFGCAGLRSALLRSFPALGIRLFWFSLALYWFLLVWGEGLERFVKNIVIDIIENGSDCFCFSFDLVPF